MMTVLGWRVTVNEMTVRAAAGGAGGGWLVEQSRQFIVVRRMKVVVDVITRQLNLHTHTHTHTHTEHQTKALIHGRMTLTKILPLSLLFTREPRCRRETARCRCNFPRWRPAAILD